MMKNANENKTNKRKPVKLVIILVVIALSLTALFFIGREVYEYYNGANVLINDAEALKSELKLLVTHVEKGNYEAANLSVQKIDSLSAEMRSTLNDDRWVRIKEKTPQYGEDLKTAEKFLDVIDEASDTLIKPGVQFLREKGLPSKSTFSKIDAELGNTLTDYADLIDKLCPAAEKVLDDFNALPQFQVEKLENKVSKYRTLAKDNAPEIVVYLKFLKETSDGFVRPVSKFLTENGNSLKIEFSMDKIGPEMSAQLLMYADAIDGLTPAAEKVLKDFNELPPLKVEKIEAKAAKYRKLAKDYESDVIDLMKFAREMSSGVIRPAAAVMTRSPVSNLKTESGDIDTKIIRDYLSFVETVKPYITRVEDVFRTNRILKEHPKQTAKITSKLDKAKELLEEYNTYVPLIDVVLGDGSDKLYLIVAQNSAEIRAGGGLPSSIGTVSIKNGIMHIGEFKPVFSLIPKFPKNYKVYSNFSKEEQKLFIDNWYGYSNKMTQSTINPHFPRAAQLIATSYTKEQKKKVSGVISMTPTIVGRLIGVMGPLTLSNGVKLDEKYAIKYLQRDIYYQYFTKKALKNEKIHKQADLKTNALFAEAAKKVISGVMSDLNLKTVVKVLGVVKKSSEDRVFMMWMANSKDEEVVKQLGCSGALNYDKQNPEIGIFFGIRDSNKLGIYVDMKVTLGKETVNKDGSVTYPVTVKVKNDIDSTSVSKGKNSAYLTSKHGGNMRPFILFFAPKGGKISSFKNNSKLDYKKGTYKDLKVYYYTPFTLKPKKTVTFTYKVTTAPGVNTVPKIVTTPLLSEYRYAKAPA